MAQVNINLKKKLPPSLPFAVFKEFNSVAKDKSAYMKELRRCTCVSLQIERQNFPEDIITFNTALRIGIGFRSDQQNKLIKV
jgi:hypothetical protein